MCKDSAIVFGKNFSEWDSAIKDAKARITRLKKSIRLWEEMRDKGEKWPGFEVSNAGAPIDDAPAEKA